MLHPVLFVILSYDESLKLSKYILHFYLQHNMRVCVCEHAWNSIESNSGLIWWGEMIQMAVLEHICVYMDIIYNVKWGTWKQDLSAGEQWAEGQSSLEAKLLVLLCVSRRLCSVVARKKCLLHCVCSMTCTELCLEEMLCASGFVHSWLCHCLTASCVPCPPTAFCWKHYNCNHW